MATRSLIAIPGPDDSYRAVYCHFDGYVEGGVGETLQDYWTDEDEIIDLINSGGMSTLGNDLAKCEFYKDRGEELEIITAPSFDDLKQIAKEYGGEYLHLYSPEKKRWHHYTLRGA